MKHDEERMQRMQPVLDRIPEQWGKYLPGPGWDDLLLQLDSTVGALDPDYKILQAKEKFGALRFYPELSPDLSESRRELIYSVIGGVETLSEMTCEECGSTAGARPRDGGWIKTLCDHCNDEREARRSDGAA